MLLNFYGFNMGIKLKSLNIFWFMVHVDQIQSYLNLKIGHPPQY